MSVTGVNKFRRVLRSSKRAKFQVNFAMIFTPSRRALCRSIIELRAISIAADEKQQQQQTADHRRSSHWSPDVTNVSRAALSSMSLFHGYTYQI